MLARSMKFIDSCRAKPPVLDQVGHAIKDGEKHLAVLIWLGVIDSVALQKFGCGFGNWAWSPD